MSDCYICFDTDANDDDLIFCTNHQFHRYCLEQWARSLPGKLKDRRNCMLCEKELPVQFSIPKYEEADLEMAVKADKDLELFFMLKQFTVGDEIYWKLLKLAFQNSSFKVLRGLRKWSHLAVIDFDMMKKLYHEASHAALCWFLDDWEIDPIRNLTSSEILRLVEERKRYRDLYTILMICYKEFNRQEQIRIGTDFS